MRGVHEDIPGNSSFWYVTYRRGSIVTNSSGAWGVVTAEGGSKWHSSPTITWLVDDEWSEPKLWSTHGLSASYVHTYAGIPDEVLAKSTYYKLVDTDDEPVTTDSK